MFGDHWDTTVTDIMVTSHYIPHINIVYGLLTVLWCSNCIAVSRLSHNQTFLQAINDRKCRLVGLGQTGEITDINKRDLLIDWEQHPRAWIAANIERVWIQFEGCYRSNVGNNLGLDLSTNNMKACFAYCNNRNIFLSNDRCFCEQNVVTHDSCNAESCRYSNGLDKLLCGSKTSFPGIFHLQSSKQCLCQYGIDVHRQLVQGDGDCMTATYQQYLPTKYRAVSCSEKHMSICQHSNLFPVFIRSESPWSQSIENCYRRDHSILRTNGLPYQLNNGTYWTGSFAVTTLRWGVVRSNNTLRTCIAVTGNKDGDVTFIRLPCDACIPALCYSSTHADVIVPNTDVTVGTAIDITSQIYPYSKTTTSTDVNISEIQSSSGHNNSDVTLVTAVALGSLLLLLIPCIVVMFLFVKRRKLIRENSIIGSTSDGNINPAVIDTRYSTPDISQYVDTMDNIYDELNDFRRDRVVPEHDLYDHAFTGDTDCTYGHLNAVNYQYADNEYDHTFTGETDDHYQRLGSIPQQNIDSYYDHTTGGSSGECSSSDDINTDHHVDRHPFDVMYDDVNKRESDTVIPVYAKVIKRSQRQPHVNGE